MKVNGLNNLKTTIMEISSIFTVTDYKSGASVEEEITGSGLGAIRFLRKQYPRFTKFVLNGFVVNGVFKKLNLR